MREHAEEPPPAHLALLVVVGRVPLVAGVVTGVRGLFLAVFTEPLVFVLIRKHAFT